MASKLSQALQATAEVYGRAMSAYAVEVFIEDLTGYSETDLLSALSRCRRELRTFPTVADILTRIDDGRPGAEEAWSMLPKSEIDSVVWTEEIRDAYAIARPLLDSDTVAARMAFKETYSKLLADSRAARRVSKWEPSLGFDKNGQKLALQLAVQKNRITEQHALSLVPDLNTQTKKLQIKGPSEEPSFTGLSAVIEKVLENAPPHVKAREIAKRIESQELTPEQVESRKNELLKQAKIVGEK